MSLPAVNYLAVVVTGVLLFMLGGLWYSPALFANSWMAHMGKSREEMMKAAEGKMAAMYGSAVVASLLVAWTMAVVIKHFPPYDALRGAEVGALCWLGLAGATSYSTSAFSAQPAKVWMINPGHTLLHFGFAGGNLSVWR